MIMSDWVRKMSERVWIWLSACVNVLVSKWKCVNEWATELLSKREWVRISENEWESESE